MNNHAFKSYKARVARDERRHKCDACSLHRNSGPMMRLQAHGCASCRWVEGVLARPDTPMATLLAAAMDDCKHAFLAKNPLLPGLAARHTFRQAAAWGVFHWTHNLLVRELSNGVDEGESPEARAVADLLGPPAHDSPTGFAFLHNLTKPDWYKGFEAHPDRLALMRLVLERLARFGHRPVLADALGLP